MRKLSTLQQRVLHRQASCVRCSSSSAPAPLSRRRVLHGAALLVAAPGLARAEPEGVPGGVELVAYRDERNRFTLTRPAAWAAASKAGATVLFKDPASAFGTLGVTVSPVLVPSLTQFGSLEAVTAKLVAAERDKDSTLDVQVLASRQRVSAHGAPLYEIEYLLTNDYGRKKVLTAVCIDASVLYIYALQFKSAEGEPPAAVAPAAEAMLAAFEPGQ